MQPDHTDNAAAKYASEDVARRRLHWDRLLWQAAKGKIDPRDLAHKVLHTDDLHAVVGEGVYVALVEWASVDDDDLAAIDLWSIHQAVFPRACFCRRHSPMDYDELSFAKRNVYRRLYFNDECIAQMTTTLFRRTEHIDLIRCDSCGDLWLRGMDLDWGRQHFLLLEPDDLGRIERDGVWPDGLDPFEVDWTKDISCVHSRSPDLADWQAGHNTAESVLRFTARGRQAGV